jgi:hypothetical protein
VAREASSLMVVLRAHRFDHSRGGLRIEPEQSVGRDVVVAVVDDEVEIGVIQRGLPKACFHQGSAPMPEVVWMQHRFGA